MRQRWIDWLISPRYALGRLIALTVVGVLCLLGAGLVWWQNQARAERALVPLQSPWANCNERGVNVDLQQYEGDDLERTLAQIEAAGFRWVRQRFPWNEIEPRRVEFELDEFEWTRWDAIVEGCDRHGLTLLAVLDGSPAWAHSDLDGDSPLAPPHQVSDWGAFVRAFAARYRGKVGAYQMWDEPNLADHWGNKYVDPVAWTALLREGTVQVRQNDPGAPVLLAALAPTVEPGPLNLNEVEFLRRVVEAGGAGFFDIVAVQPYGFGDPPGASADAAQLNWKRAALVRREMVRLGLGDVPVWATAWGWNAFTGNAPNPWPVVSAQQQADYTLEALHLARRDWPWLGPTFLYTWQPDVPVDNPRWGFALIDSDGQETPLLEAITIDNGKKYPVYTGVYVPDAHNAEYTGAWRFSDAGADPPQDASESERNAIIAFDFVGTALDLRVRRGDFWGFFYVSVDGRPANSLPRDESGRAYLILHDPQGSIETVMAARELSEQAHRVEIVAHGGWGQWPLIGWTVRDEKSPPPGAALWGVLLLIGALALVIAVGQFLFTPQAAQPIYALIGRAFKRYRALPEWVPVLLTSSVALAFYLVPWTALALPLLVVLFALVFLRIDLGLALVALSLPFYTRPKLLFGWPFSVVELFLWECLVAWLLARLLDWGRAAMQQGMQAIFTHWLAFLNEWPLRLLGKLGEFARRPNWRGRVQARAYVLDLGVAALLVVAWLAVNVAEYRDVAWHEFRVVFLESALFYALIRWSIKSERAWRRLVEGWLLGNVIVAAIGLIQWATGQNLITADGISRVRGFYGSPNNLALYLMRALPVLLAAAWLDKNRVRRIVYGMGALPVLGASLLTFSKGALLLGLPASILALGWLQFRHKAGRRKAIWTTAGALVVLALLLTPLAFTDRFRGWFDPSSGTAFFRLKLWRATWSMIVDHPIWGVGPDNFLYHYRTRYVLPSAWGELDLSHPHNLLLDAWTRLGLPGLIVVGWLVGWFVHTSWGKLSRFGDNRTLVLGIAASMAALLAHGLVDHAMFLIDLGFVFMLLLAVAQKREA
ncbi:MAG: O-antigen ligase family protein [Anaerolineae bacterium]|nr:O-antigen ligase family protein [Anaerolineae bacterium]